jgi:antitoxin component of MazEF toxin-antitoxin module
MSVILKADAAGTLTIPADVCREAGLNPGAEVAVEADAGRLVVSRPRATLGERIATRARALPSEVLAVLPDDLASQHDHYLYGTPKRPE